MGKHTTHQLNKAADKYFAREKVLSAIDAEDRLSVNSFTAYVDADSFIGNPDSLLGRVMMVRKTGANCPQSFTDRGFMTQLVPLPIPGIEIDSKSRIDQPIQRGSIIVTKEMSANVSFLTYLSGSFTGKNVFSIMLTDQATGLINVQLPSWKKGLDEWLSDRQNLQLLEDPNVCYLYIIVGYVRKDVIRKAYEKLDVEVGGGAYGINVNGTIHTSNEAYFLDIKFGITPVILKSPTYKIQLDQNDLVDQVSLEYLRNQGTKVANFILTPESRKLQAEPQRNLMPKAEVQNSIQLNSEEQTGLNVFRSITRIDPDKKSKEEYSFN